MLCAFKVSLLLFKLVFKCNPPQSSGHNPIVSSIFTEIDIPFVVCVIYWSLPTSGSPQEIAWNGPKLVYDCVVWAGAVMVLILCPPLLGIYIKLICIVFMECLLKLVNSTAASGWWCSSKHPGGSAVEYKLRLSKAPRNKSETQNGERFIQLGSKAAECGGMRTVVWTEASPEL